MAKRHRRRVARSGSRRSGHPRSWGIETELGPIVDDQPRMAFRAAEPHGPQRLYRQLLAALDWLVLRRLLKLAERAHHA